MRLEGIQIRDIVELDRLGRRFPALVTGNASGGLPIQPLDRRVTYRSCRAHEVIPYGRSADGRELLKNPSSRRRYNSS